MPWKVCDRRHPSQSLREHFMKQMYPQLYKFDLTKKQILRFKRSWQGLQVCCSIIIWFYITLDCNVNEQNKSTISDFIKWTFQICHKSCIELINFVFMKKNLNFLKRQHFSGDWERGQWGKRRRRRRWDSATIRSARLVRFKKVNFGNFKCLVLTIILKPRRNLCGSLRTEPERVFQMS